MKKLLTTTATVTLFTGILGLNNHAEAKSVKKDINYLNKETAKKVMNGTVSLHGIKIGDKLSKFKNKSSYYVEDDKVGVSGSMDTDRGLTDFQQYKKNATVTRLMDERSYVYDRDFYRNDMLKIYKKPAKGYSFIDRNGHCRVDIYNHVSFVYCGGNDISNPILTNVNIYNKKLNKKLFKYFINSRNDVSTHDFFYIIIKDKNGNYTEVL